MFESVYEYLQNMIKIGWLRVYKLYVKSNSSKREEYLHIIELNLSRNHQISMPWGLLLSSAPLRIYLLRCLNLSIKRTSSLGQ